MTSKTAPASNSSEVEETFKKRAFSRPTAKSNPRLHEITETYIPVSKLKRQVKQSTGADMMSVEAAVLMAAHLSYLAAEILEASADGRGPNPKVITLTGRHLVLGLSNDDDLNRLIGSGCIRSSGIAPTPIHRALLGQKRTAGESVAAEEPAEEKPKKKKAKKAEKTEDKPAPKKTSSKKTAVQEKPKKMKKKKEPKPPESEAAPEKESEQDDTESAPSSKETIEKGEEVQNEPTTAEEGEEEEEEEELAKDIEEAMEEKESEKVPDSQAVDQSTEQSAPIF